MVVMLIKAMRPSMQKVVEFFRKNPNPSDNQVHKWAEDNGFDPHAVEEVIYALATVHVEKHMEKAKSAMIRASCGDEMEAKLRKEGLYIEGKTKLKADTKELALGVKIEMEHMKSHKVARQIALDHLTEDPKYYTHLKKIEKARKMSIGTISHGRKKVAEGRWVPVSGKEPVYSRSGMNPTQVKGRIAELQRRWRSTRVSARTSLIPGQYDQLGQTEKEIKELGGTVPVVLPTKWKAAAKTYGVSEEVLAEVKAKGYNLGSVTEALRHLREFRGVSMKKMKNLNAGGIGALARQVREGKAQSKFKAEHPARKSIQLVSASKLAKAKYTKRTGSPGNYRYEYGEKKGRVYARFMYTGKDSMTNPKKVLINNEGYVVSVNGKKISPTPIEDYGEYYLSKKPVSDALNRWGKKTEATKSLEDNMKKSGVALILIPGELTKAAKLSGVGSGHPAGLSGVDGNTKSKIPYTGHVERMKLAKMAMQRMLGVSAPESEKEHTSTPVVDRKGRVAGEKSPYTGYGTGVSGMGSQAHDNFGRATMIVKPSEIGSSAPEGSTKHTPIKNVRASKK